MFKQFEKCYRFSPITICIVLVNIELYDCKCMVIARTHEHGIQHTSEMSRSYSSDMMVRLQSSSFIISSRKSHIEYPYMCYMPHNECKEITMVE